MGNWVCSKGIEAYFEGLLSEANRCYEVARAARAKGFDPELDVEVPQTQDLAARVERLLRDYGIGDVAELIRELSKQHDRESVSILVAKEVAKRTRASKDKAIEAAVRVGLAILTEGILVAPLEGLAEVKLKTNIDGSSYVDLHYAGPIRSAGGTAQALSVLIADIVRRDLGIGKFKPMYQEVDRLKEEIPLYKQTQHLQYTPSDEEIDLIVSNCPVCINGEATEEVEISGHRDLPRIETNRLRGGACLVISDGLCLKAPKIQRHVKRLDIDGWEFIEKYIGGKAVESSERQDDDIAVDASDKFIQNVLAGRPVLSHPSRPGAFRLRYGRTRATGIATVALHPATMAVMDNFIAIGTQIKTERPGKAATVTPCNNIEGPIVLLKNGDLVAPNSVKEVEILRSSIECIVDLGEVLIPFGEFIENNHVLMPGAYSLEWFGEELKRIVGKPPKEWDDLTFSRAIMLCEKHGLPLHPKYNLFWHDLKASEILDLRGFVQKNGFIKGESLILPLDTKIKQLLCDLGALHRTNDGNIVVGFQSQALIRCLGLASKEEKLERIRDSEKIEVLALVSELAGIEVKARGPTRIGARMGRPEKAAPRKMKPAPHALFPVGKDGGPQRLLSEALEKADTEIQVDQKRLMRGVQVREPEKVEVGLRVCPSCGKRWFLPKCTCGAHTQPRNSKARQRIPLREVYNKALSNVSLQNDPPETKCVQGMISRNKTPEPLEKGLLRAKHGVFVFKDGTTRFDLTNLPLTHFTPVEAGLSIDDAKELGYDVDIEGRPLEREDQLVELRVHDIIVSRECGEYLVKASNFIDEMLEKLYAHPAFYKTSIPEDLVGQLVVGLAPHTSGGVLARVIGFTPAKVCFAHPYFHAAKRRNCDGDEDSIILLLDCLINFSRSFLPEKRGGLMDAPLILTTHIDPNEIDKEAHNIDLRWEYPEEFFMAASHFAQPRDMERLMDMVGSRIGSVLQYEGFGFTHGTNEISNGPLSSAYGEGNMEEKLEAQLALASKIRAVDTTDVVARIVVHHFLPDLIGNLKAFSSQQFRCTKCNTKFRRMPLKGHCTSQTLNGRDCRGNLVLTVHPSSVKKYLEISKRIAEQYGVSSYLRQRLDLADEAIASLFSNGKSKSLKLDDFL